MVKNYDFDEESSSSSSSSENGSDIEQQRSSNEQRRSSKSNTKKKKKKSIEDAIDKKLKSKKKKEKKAAKAEDALEEKIRKKQAAVTSAYSAAAVAGGTVGPAVVGASATRKSSNGRGTEEEISMGVAAVRSATKRVPGYEEVKVEEGAEAGELFTRGGGDVRNRPKIKPSEQTKQLDPLRAAEEAKKKNAKQVNKRFADLHENGAWGGLSKWEKYGLCTLALGAIGAAIGLGITFSKSDESAPPEQTPQPTLSPTDVPTVSPTNSPTTSTNRETRGLELMTDASPVLSLPSTPEELRGAKSNPDSTPQEIAGEFVLYDDELRIPAEDPRFIERYALSVLYLSNGGCAEEWIDSTNWMSPSLDHCDNWFGVKCTLQGRVEEIILKQNFVSGKVPIELSQFGELRALDLSGNAMTGEVPGDLGGLYKLFSLQLQNNMLTGEFPFDELREGAIALDTLWIQENGGLSGEITEAYCTLSSITLDCANFEPQPTYVVDDTGVETTTTTFEQNCDTAVGTHPREYTCNFGTGVKITVAPTPTPGGGDIPTLVRDTYCGVPSVAA
mmetsp:Transcript_31569/g.66046  ORF Transcript_31569/g.66046 Transcript_31569/m.66046 type:complete len:559 (+) Transcript_31569:165-1841(+)